MLSVVLSTRAGLYPIAGVKLSSPEPSLSGLHAVDGDTAPPGCCIMHDASMLIIVSNGVFEKLIIIVFIALIRDKGRVDKRERDDRNRGGHGDRRGEQHVDRRGEHPPRDHEPRDLMGRMPMRVEREADKEHRSRDRRSESDPELPVDRQDYPPQRVSGDSLTSKN